jgi:hypothetical protein
MLDPRTQPMNPQSRWPPADRVQAVQARQPTGYGPPDRQPTGYRPLRRRDGGCPLRRATLFAAGACRPSAALGHRRRAKPGENGRT